MTERIVYKASIIKKKTLVLINKTTKTKHVSQYNPTLIYSTTILSRTIWRQLHFLPSKVKFEKR